MSLSNGIGSYNSGVDYSKVKQQIDDAKELSYKLQTTDFTDKSSTENLKKMVDTVDLSVVDSTSFDKFVEEYENYKKNGKESIVGKFLDAMKNYASVIEKGIQDTLKKDAEAGGGVVCTSEVHDNVGDQWAIVSKKLDEVIRKRIELQGQKEAFHSKYYKLEEDGTRSLNLVDGLTMEDYANGINEYNVVIGLLDAIENSLTSMKMDLQLFYDKTWTEYAQRDGETVYTNPYREGKPYNPETSVPENVENIVVRTDDPTYGGNSGYRTYSSTNTVSTPSLFGNVTSNNVVYSNETNDTSSVAETTTTNKTTTSSSVEFTKQNYLFSQKDTPEKKVNSVITKIVESMKSGSPEVSKIIDAIKSNNQQITYDLVSDIAKEVGIDVSPDELRKALNKESENQ